MKTLIFAVALVVGISAFAQEAPKIDKTFIRVFDLEGERFTRGKIQSFSDTSLLLKGQQGIDPKNIGYIKTKHSTGNNVLIGTLAGALFSGALMAASADPDDFFGYTAEEGFALGAIIGAPIGAFLGWISSFLKKNRTFIINGDVQKWQEFQDTMGSKKLTSFKVL